MALQPALHGGIRRVPAPPAAPEGDGRLVVGARLRVKCAEVQDCDSLLVEGTLEATLSARLLRVAEHGHFKGAAEVEQAEVRGVFEGRLTARERLVVHATGRVSGQVRYGKLVIEEGGSVSGELAAQEPGSPAQVTATGEGGG